ncbi:copper homeostasis CutC domain-containing protein [Chaetomium strumarium]|uniref:Copper homeostasis protein cutC homolog n=1 Tax=Chaetomium strumarium TaxID=1170767 RepID=A0AAJ0M4P5_9PEZI|nr:copper homeostasis CutC domain-containing protein [Chaetomium strumarium]
MAFTAGPPLEVPIFGADTGALAASFGTSRLELNRAESYAQGGITPTLNELTTLLSSLSHDNRPTVRIMIRPRGPPSSPRPESNPGRKQDLAEDQDFIYTPEEFSAMIGSIKQFISSGLLDPSKGDGFVFGILKRTASDGALELDQERNTELVTVVKKAGFKAVLHRAVDALFSQCGSEAGSAADAVGRVMEAVRECGFDVMLTSGGLGSAAGNVVRLREVVAAAEREGVEVIVGGGVRSGKLRGLFGGLGLDLGERNVGAVWFHSSCLRISVEGQETFDQGEASGLAHELRGLCMESKEKQTQGS